MKILQTYIRVYVNDMDSSLEFYEGLTGENSTLRFKYDAVGLELASVGDIF